MPHSSSRGNTTAIGMPPTCPSVFQRSASLDIYMHPTYGYYRMTAWDMWDFALHEQEFIYFVSSQRQKLKQILIVRLFARPSVCLSVCHTNFNMFPSWCHDEIFRSYHQWQKWCPCKRSRSEVKGLGHRGRKPILPFPDRNSSLNSHVMMKWYIKLDVAPGRCPFVLQGHKSNFMVTRLKKSSIVTPIGNFRTVTPSTLNPLMVVKWCTKLELT